MATDADTSPKAPGSPDGPASRVKKPVFITSAVITVLVTLWCVIAPGNAEAVLGTVVGWVSTWRRSTARI